MKTAYIPYGTLLISVLTLLYSMYVAFDVTGSALGNVKITQLEPYGGVTFAHLGNLEFWRLFASQLIHAKQMHMLYNVLCIVLLGAFLEQYIHKVQLLSIWFFSGAVGTLVGTLFVVPPWNLGTGASQAVLGMAAFGLILYLNGANSSRWLLVVVFFSLIPAFALDLIYAGYPKPGHVVGASIGAIAALIYSRKNSGGLQRGSPVLDSL